MNRRTRRMSDDAVRRIGEYIQANRMAVGERLPSIRAFSDMWGIGTGTVRDAFLQAQSAGIVKMSPRSGTFVQTVDLPGAEEGPADILTTLAQETNNIFHLIDARILMEVYLAGEAAVNRRPEDLFPLREALQAMERDVDDWEKHLEDEEAFHIGIAKIVDNPILTGFLRLVFSLMRPYRMQAATPEWHRNAKRTHTIIYNTILEGDKESARTAMRNHLSTQRMAAMEYVTSAL